MPGIAFLSGGQAPVEATTHLSLMNVVRPPAVAADLQLWARAAGCRAHRLGRQARRSVESGQREFARWARLNSLARGGRFKPGMDSPGRLMEVPAAPAEAVVEVRDLRYSIGGRTIFDGLNLTVRRGEITAVMGPSGTGKTTLLRLMMGAIRPDSGDRSRLFGERPCAAPPRRPVCPATAGRHAVPERRPDERPRRVFENVAFPLRAHTRLPEPLLRRLVLMKLQAVGLRGAAEFATGSLSGGMARRVALASAIVMDPELLIYDEPFAGPRSDIAWR